MIDERGEAMDVDSSDVVVMKFRLEPWMLLRGSWALNRVKLTLYGIGSLTLAIVVLYTSWLTDDLSTAYILSPALIVLYLVSYGLIPWVRCRRMVHEPNFAGECEMMAGEAGLSGKNEHIQSLCEWSVFTRFLDLQSLFVLRIGRRGIMVIPKTAFAGNDDMERFRSLVTSKITAS